MNHGIILIVLCVVSCAFGAPSPLALFFDIPEGRIVGGSETTISQFPWQVSLNFFGNHRCGGAIVSEKVVISAAHCTYGIQKNTLSVRAGSTKRTSGGIEISVDSFVNHPEFNPTTLDYDFSILFLASALPFGSNIAQIPLASQDNNVRAYDHALVSGWGTLGNGGSSPDRLQYVSVPLTEQEECTEAYKDYNEVTDRMICAGVIGVGGKDACQGDSGGPLVVDSVLVGIVSWGHGCAEPNFPGVYSKVSAVRDWIDSTIGPM